MIVRRRVRKRILYVIMYTCLLYMTALMMLLSQLSESENAAEGFDTRFVSYENDSRVYTLGFLTARTSLTPQLTTTIKMVTKKMARQQVDSKNTKIGKDNVKSVISNHTLRRWSKKVPLVFLHIGKNGGTSFDKVVRPIISKLGGRYIGNRHFDWSYIDTLKNPDVVVLLRDPVSRSVSHFHFSRKKRIFKMTSSTLIEYLHNPQDMLESRDVWQDGQASVMWLTGTHVANWVGIKPHQIPEREIQSLDHEAILTKAAERINQTLWFGFLSDQDRSFEMLQAQIGYSQNIRLSKSNINPHSEISAEEEQILKSLMPMDLWLYDYAKLLFEARWKHYKTGMYEDPELPPFPEPACKSTRFILACNKMSPIGPLYHVWNISRDNTLTQVKLLPKNDWL